MLLVRLNRDPPATSMRFARTLRRRVVPIVPQKGVANHTRTTATGGGVGTKCFRPLDNPGHLARDLYG